MGTTYSKVSIREEIQTFPTYQAGEPNPNPMYLEKRVYQGSSGVVYPHPIIDSVSTAKTDKDYRVVILENDFIKIMVMPELGGRIQMAYDKKRDYHFVYFNQVIKPALVGLAGPWLSGGIEFNWPQHHRPSTFDPMQYQIQEHPDGSATLWVGEVERMFRTYGSAGITLFPDRAMVKITGKLYNPTRVPQTFLWWANPAVAVNDDYQSIFPPDVHAVFDHGKRDVSEFPIAKGTYYKVDYSKGVDISWYKNIPVPTSYMAYHSDFDFVGGYAHDRKTGILHVADHHVSPGKKMWTWGNGDFAKAWERNLTDQDGPYIELMTGVFTDNQPDFSWIMPGEYKEFTQHFMPYAEIPRVCCANEYAVIGLEVEQQIVHLRIYSPRKQTLIIRVVQEPDTEASSASTWTRNWLPGDFDTFSFKLTPGSTLEQYRISLTNESGIEVLSYREGELQGKPVPESAKAARKPKDIPTMDELYHTGLHIEQYRHATRDPELYYLEGLSRDHGDLRCNMAMGLRRFKSGDFDQARIYFEQAVQRETSWNTNTVHSESYYYLGLCQLYQKELMAALTSFGKAAWSKAAAARSWYYMAVIYTKLGKYDLGLNRIHQACSSDPQMVQARFLKALLLKLVGQTPEANQELTHITQFFPLYFPALVELQLQEDKETMWHQILNYNGYTLLEVALEYRFYGLYKQALDLVQFGLAKLEHHSNSGTPTHDLPQPERAGSNPMRANRGVLPQLYYLEADLLALLDQDFQASLENAETADHRYCFPNQLEYVDILQWAASVRPNSSRALYYLGCLFYDKRRHQDAHVLWEQSAKIMPDFAPVQRNLALSFFNKKQHPANALTCLNKAVSLSPQDPRLVLELNALLKKTGAPVIQRKELLETLGPKVSLRDDLSLEYAAVLNLTGEYEKAKELLLGRQFQPWEGGEGQVPAQYRISLIGIAREHLVKGLLELAEGLLNQALEYPESLGEGKLPNTPDNEIHYYLGWLHLVKNDPTKAKEHFNQALIGDDTPSMSFFYNDTPADALFYRGLAHIWLNQKEKAQHIFDILCQYGTTHLEDQIEIDYFAVSLPEFLVFDDDLTLKNRTFCQFLIGLGTLGQAVLKSQSSYQDKQQSQEVQQLKDLSRKALLETLTLDPSHSQGAVLLKLSSQWELLSQPKQQD